MNKLISTLLAVSMVGAIAVQAQAALPFTVSLESETAGLQVSTSGFYSVGVETFNGRATGEPQNFTTNFGSTTFTGTYTGVGVNNADQYGGAFGSGQYANSQSSRSYTLDLQSTSPRGVTYFGYWLSALDANNSVSFFQGNDLLFNFNAADAANFINGLPNNSSYFGNPNAPFAGNNPGEPYAFLNFYARTGTRFDRVVFTQGPGGGYESDNHTVGRWNRMSGTIFQGDTGAVPEPASWAMLIAGFGLVGAAARRRRTKTVAA
jgi:hypothetical protein